MSTEIEEHGGSSSRGDPNLRWLSQIYQSEIFDALRHWVKPTSTFIQAHHKTKNLVVPATKRQDYTAFAFSLFLEIRSVQTQCLGLCSFVERLP